MAPNISRVCLYCRVRSDSSWVIVARASWAEIVSRVNGSLQDPRCCIFSQQSLILMSPNVADEPFMKCPSDDSSAKLWLAKAESMDWNAPSACV